MNLPASVGIAVFALFFGVNGVWLAWKLFWQRQRQIFWFSSGAIVIAIGYLVATGAAEGIARNLWPIAFDPVKGKEFMLRAPCEQPRSLGFALIAGPIALVLAPVLLLKFSHRPALTSLVTALFGVSALLLYISPNPEKLARLVLPEDILKVPSYCAQINR